MNEISLKFSIMITTVALTAMLAGVWLADIYREHDSRAMLLPDQVITLFPDPKPLTAFALTDHKNRVFDLASLKGKWSFLFFGFTHCPDVCPTTLAVLARAHDSIAKNTVGAEDIQFVFISVDPNRDTASKLEQYVDYFDTTRVSGCDHTGYGKLSRLPHHGGIPGGSAGPIPCRVYAAPRRGGHQQAFQSGAGA